MHRTRIALTLALTASLALAATAGARPGTVHHYRSQIESITLWGANGYPNVGGIAELVGTVDLGSMGSGALVDHIKITGHPSSTVFAFRGTEVDYLTRGSVRSTFSGTSTVRPDGSQVSHATGKFSGGTGIYRGASGKYVYEGFVPAGST
ncbi:MAG: hypothetical protein QOF12_2408, partial [Solirubrobacteraceae bacterium]|nr:hypothetical protein [Solirubrobacteraceae bacterium]